MPWRRARSPSGGFSAAGAAESVVRGVPTSGRIADGGIAEREIPFELGSLRSIRIAPRNPDFTTARRVADAINGDTGQNLARAQDSGTVILDVAGAGEDAATLITRIEQLSVEPDQPERDCRGIR